MQALYAPGARVVIRDCEWIVRRAVPCDDDGYILTAGGLSELVMGNSAQLLTSLEEQAGNIKRDTQFPENLEQWILSGPHFFVGSAYKIHKDDTLLGGPTERTVEYKALFFKSDREEDYRVAWEIFSQTHL